jgi:hypothetical protein
MGLSGINSENNKYLAELSKGRTLPYDGEKYHSYSDGNEIAWFDRRGARAGTSLELTLTSMYIKSRQKNSKIKELLAA